MVNLFHDILNITHVTWKDILDILFIAFLIYRLLILIRGTRAIQILMGLIFVFVFYFFFLWADFRALSWVLQNFWKIWVIGIIVLFQPEIRRGLASVGQHSFLGGYSNVEQGQLIDRLVRIVISLTEKRTGALIAVERVVKLQNYVEIGTKVDALISKELIMGIFFPNSPLHDGAIIIQDGRISGAGTFLPLTLKLNLSQSIGTRHRAAIGLTEETDAVVIVVSEETGFISVAMGGELEMDVDSVRLKAILKASLVSDTSRKRDALFRMIGSQKEMVS